jgi:hypothetical protein
LHPVTPTLWRRPVAYSSGSASYSIAAIIAGGSDLSNGQSAGLSPDLCRYAGKMAYEVNVTLAQSEPESLAG